MRINRKTELKKMEKQNKQKHNNNNNNKKYTYTITSKFFSLAYFSQKILSGYCSDDIYKKGLHPLPP